MTRRHTIKSICAAALALLLPRKAPSFRQSLRKDLSDGTFHYWVDYSGPEGKYWRGYHIEGMTSLALNHAAITTLLYPSLMDDIRLAIIHRQSTGQWPVGPQAMCLEFRPRAVGA